MYPKYKHHPEKPAVIVQDAEQEKALGAGWCESPAEYGVESHPGEVPDADILEMAPSKKPAKGSKRADPADKAGE